MLFNPILTSLGLGLVTALYVTNSQAAERIAFNYPPFGEFYIYIEDLADFSNEGKVNSRLNYFTKGLSSEQLDKFQTILGQEIPLNPVTVYRFTNSSVGEEILRQLGEIVRSDLESVKRRRDRSFNKTSTAKLSNNLLALRGAINQAANHPDGFTVLNILRQFPLQTIYFDLPKTLSLIETGIELLEQRESAINSLQQEVSTDINNIPAREQNLSLPGNYKWHQLSFTFHNPHRIASSPFELYLPETDKPVPLIIISHGLASNRITFEYLGKHFASYGFAVAIPEHIATNFEQFERFLSGQAKLPQGDNLILQPLDIKYLLDWLHYESESNRILKNKIDLQQVGLVGHSLGGYTALALAGGQINWGEIKQQCLDNEANNIGLNLSILIQCSFQELPIKDYQLIEPRIKSAIAISPFASIIFGQEGIEPISIPTMIISGTKDPITPAVPEQIYPFTWLETPDKYLLLVDPANHFSFLEESIGILPVPDSIVGLKPSLAYPGLKHFTTAFFQVHLSQNSEDKIYLQQSYADSFTDKFIKISIIESLENFKIE